MSEPRDNPTLVAIAQLSGAKTIRVIRTIMYEGPTQWVHDELEKSWLQGPQHVQGLLEGQRVTCVEDRVMVVD